MRMSFSTVSRYVLYRTVPWIGICLFGVVSIFLATQLLRTASVFIGADGLSMIRLIGLLSIPVVAYAAAPACFIALFAAAGKMRADDELSAVDALGISRLKAVSSLVGFLVVLTLADAFLWLYVVPAALGPARDIAVVSLRNAAFRQIEPGRFNRPFPGLVFFAESRDGNGAFLRPFVDWRAPEGHFEIAAENVRLSASDPLLLTMRFSNGRAFIDGNAAFEKGGAHGTSNLSAAFKDFVLTVPLDGLTAQKLDFLPRTFTISTARLAGSSIDGISSGMQRFALWRRIAGPVGFFFLSFFGLWVAFGVQWKNRARAVFFGVITFLAFQLFSRWGESLFLSGRLSPAWGAMLPASVPAALIVFFVLYHFYMVIRRVQGGASGLRE